MKINSRILTSIAALSGLLMAAPQQALATHGGAAAANVDGQGLITVRSSITIVNDRAIDFGTVILDGVGPSSVNMTPGPVDTNIRTLAAAFDGGTAFNSGRWIVTGIPNHAFTVVVTQGAWGFVAASGTGAAAVLTWGAPEYHSQVLGLSNTNGQLASAAPVAPQTSRQDRLWVGGTVNIPQIADGDYTSTINVAVNY